MGPYEVVDFHSLTGVPCPCGSAKRAYAETADWPGTLHVTEICENSRLHYHKRLTETYFFLECEPHSQMQLENEFLDVHAGMSILIRPGTRHRAIGRMTVLIVVIPKFDEDDEWFELPHDAGTNAE